MVGQMFLPGVCFGTEGTSMWCFTSMEMYVIRQMLLSGERLRAVSTLERRFTRMLSVINTFRFRTLLSVFFFLNSRKTKMEIDKAFGFQSECNVVLQEKITSFCCVRHCRLDPKYPYTMKIQINYLQVLFGSPLRKQH